MTSSLDPTIIYYTHSRIRPVFTGCTTRVLDTLDEIRTGKTKIKGVNYCLCFIYVLFDLFHYYY